MVDHVVGVRDLAVLVSNDGEVERGLGDLINVLDPLAVGLDGVGGETNQLDIALGELGLELGEGTELGRADGGEV